MNKVVVTEEKAERIISWQKVIATIFGSLSTLAAVAAIGAYMDVQAMKPKVEEATQTKNILCEIAILNNWNTDTITKSCVR